MTDVKAYQRAQWWTRTDTEAVRAALVAWGVEVSPHRWPATLAIDFMRNHGDAYSPLRSESRKSIARLFGHLMVSEDFMHCLLALGYLCQDGITTGFPTAVAIANDAVVREPFEIVAAMNVELPFWIPRKESS